MGGWERGEGETYFGIRILKFRLSTFRSRSDRFRMVPHESSGWIRMVPVNVDSPSHQFCVRKNKCRKEMRLTIEVHVDRILRLITLLRMVETVRYQFEPT